VVIEAAYPGLTGPERFSDANWWMCRVWETVVIVNAFVIMRYLVKGCIAQRKVFTFDVLF